MQFFPIAGRSTAEWTAVTDHGVLAAMPIRMFRVNDLPPQVPGAVFSDAEATVILLNGRYLSSLEQSAWLREVVNSLLAEAGDTGPRHLRAVG